MKAIYTKNNKNLEFSSEEELVDIIRDNDIVIASDEGRSHLLTYEKDGRFILNSTNDRGGVNEARLYYFMDLVLGFEIFVFSDKEFYKLISGE